jgi:hypothetical protein
MRHKLIFQQNKFQVQQQLTMQTALNFDATSELAYRKLEVTNMKVGQSSLQALSSFKWSLSITENLKYMLLGY